MRRISKWTTLSQNDENLGCKSKSDKIAPYEPSPLLSHNQIELQQKDMNIPPGFPLKTEIGNQLIWMFLLDLLPKLESQKEARKSRAQSCKKLKFCKIVEVQWPLSRKNRSEHLMGFFLSILNGFGDIDMNLTCLYSGFTEAYVQVFFFVFFCNWLRYPFSGDSTWILWTNSFLLYQGKCN